MRQPAILKISPGLEVIACKWGLGRKGAASQDILADSIENIADVNAGAAAPGQHPALGWSESDCRSDQTAGQIIKLTIVILFGLIRRGCEPTGD